MESLWLCLLLSCSTDGGVFFFCRRDAWLQHRHVCTAIGSNLDWIYFDWNKFQSSLIASGLWFWNANADNEMWAHPWLSHVIIMRWLMCLKCRRSCCCCYLDSFARYSKEHVEERALEMESFVSLEFTFSLPLHGVLHLGSTLLPSSIIAKFGHSSGYFDVIRFVLRFSVKLAVQLCSPPNPRQNLCLLGIPTTSHAFALCKPLWNMWQRPRPITFHPNPLTIHLQLWIESVRIQSGLVFLVCSADAINADWMQIQCLVRMSLYCPSNGCC